MYSHIRHYLSPLATLSDSDHGTLTGLNMKQNRRWFCLFVLMFYCLTNTLKVMLTYPHWSWADFPNYWIAFASILESAVGRKRPQKWFHGQSPRNNVDGPEESIRDLQNTTRMAQVRVCAAVKPHIFRPGPLEKTRNGWSHKIPYVYGLGLPQTPYFNHLFFVRFSPLRKPPVLSARCRSLSTPPPRHTHTPPPFLNSPWRIYTTSIHEPSPSHRGIYWINSSLRYSRMLLAVLNV